MNTGDCKNSISYLEDVTKSSEYLFVTANTQYVVSDNRITYFEAFNRVGEKIFRKKWTGKEFFAGRGATDIAEYQKNHQTTYDLFESKEHQSECINRIGFAEYPILSALQSGKLQSFYINHYTGEEAPIEPSFWRSQKNSFARTRGHYKAPDRNQRPAVPSMDFIIVFNLSEFKTVLNKMPKRKPNKKFPPSKNQVSKAEEFIFQECLYQNVLLNRKIYAQALNKLLNTDFFNDSSVKPFWGAVSEQFKNVKRLEGVIYLDVENLPNHL
tara:strand:+ start:180 stop:986 length:807 start_codon:yes stop_codon:yes gene_type:complete